MRLARSRLPSLLLVLLLQAPAPVAADGVTASSVLYVDDDDTQVITPRVQLDKTLGDARLEVGYAADVWTSASIDVRTAATEAITEQRDELFASGTVELTDTTLSAGYRLSTENDYDAHGVTASIARDLAEGAATVEARLNLSLSDVGRSGDPGFSRSLFGLGGRLSWTQVLSPRALVQVGYEIERLAGFQSSPYRWVALGDGLGPLCRPQAVHCVTERHPDLRLRHAAAVRGRYALPLGWALGAGYRFYLDDWGVASHTIEADVRWNVAEGLLLGLRYRLYVQAAADFAGQPADSSAIPSVRTSDRELFGQISHRLMLEAIKTFRVGELDLRVALDAGITRFGYDGFGSLDSLSALTLGLSLQVER